MEDIGWIGDWCERSEWMTGVAGACDGRCFVSRSKWRLGWKGSGQL